MPNHIVSWFGKYKHWIVIGVALTSLAAYFIPLHFVFASHTNGNTAAGANQAARTSILNSLNVHPSGSALKGSTNPASASSSSSTSNTPSSTKTASTTPGISGDVNVGKGNTGNNNVGNNNHGNNNVGNANNGNNNRGNANTGNGNVGSANQGNNNIGHNSIGNGFIGSNCGSASGHYTCVQNGHIVRG
jgi:PPE-repeat protein